MIITGGFWMAFCVVTAYAAVFLHGAGYDDQELGIILALGNVGGAVMSPLLGAWIDRNRKIRHAQLVFALLGMQMILLAALRINPQKNLLCTICYVLYMTFMMPVNALNLDLCVRLERAKAPLNFGLARSMGSFSFVILSTLLGILTEQLGYRMLPFAGMAVIVLQGIGNRLIDRDLREAENSLPQSEAVLQERSSSLADFIREIRALGYKIKVDTNGTRPEILRMLAEKELVDYIALDIKTGREKYRELCNVDMEVEKIDESVELLKSGAFPDYEFRTTVVAEYFDEKVAKDISDWAAGGRRYFLQNFVDTNTSFVGRGVLHGQTREVIEGYAEILRRTIPEVSLRGID
jgi:hypothetical protein